MRKTGLPGFPCFFAVLDQTPNLSPIPDRRKSIHPDPPDPSYCPHSPGPCDPRTSCVLGAAGNIGGGESCCRGCRSRPGRGPGSRRPRPTAAAATGRLPQARVPAWIGSAPASYEVNRVKGELLSMKEEAVMVSCEAEMDRGRGARE